jgi:hypothetical protein
MTDHEMLVWIFRYVCLQAVLTIIWIVAKAAGSDES